jgi:hypothetical protein
MFLAVRSYGCKFACVQAVNKWKKDTKFSVSYRKITDLAFGAFAGIVEVVARRGRTAGG